MIYTNFTSLNEAKVLIETERLKIYQNPLTEEVLSDLYEIYCLMTKQLKFHLNISQTRMVT